ncbi:MAG: EscU/YscU/HrcU family type III secretion system export apparatus switch protein [Chthonomonadales bacterium]|nr:EscU/YscU/HrcU family type III secretion system export apparatus switch protein [Chthonomonadales bacterium]
MRAQGRRVAPLAAAAALRYRPGDGAAPRLVARGRGSTARQILARARACGVPIRRDEAMVELLDAVELGEQIPPELYAAAAEILAWVYRLNGGAREAS